MNIELGALCDPLTKQLKGLVSYQAARSFQRISDAILLLKIGGYLPDRDVKKAQLRLVKEISRRAARKAVAA